MKICNSEKLNKKLTIANFIVILVNKLIIEYNMDLGKLDRTTLKSILREILNEDINLFKEVIRELLIENQVIASKEQELRRQKLEMMINEDFDNYDDVFKALA